MAQLLNRPHCPAYAHMRRGNRSGAAVAPATSRSRRPERPASAGVEAAPLCSPGVSVSYFALPQQLFRLGPARPVVLSQGTFNFRRALESMIEVTSQDARTRGIASIGSQPIALAAGALVMIMLGVGSVALWRAYTGTSPEQDRIVAARQLQVRAAQASEQLVEKTKGLEATQQESIDQLQIVQDQLQTVKRLLSAQQADAKRLSEQVSGLTEAIDGLRQSFASAQAPEASGAPSTRNKSIRTRSHATRSARRKHARARG